ncbi:MAG: methyl-accepting chemotaxis protein [Lachnospiraceae bacterium]|nr:methyl-accepting chemotaxis protein [Lachnospiraceae bacterium]
MKMQSKIITLALLPLLCLGAATILIGQVRISQVVTESIENGLRGSAVSVRDTLSYVGDGEFGLNEDKLYKGEFNVSDAVEIADDIKKAADTDITVFYGDTRYMTSVLDEQGNRVVGTKAGDQVIEKVLKNGEELFSTNVDVVGHPYFGYYLPLYETGTTNIVGMVFAGMPQADAKAQITKIISLIAGVFGILFLLCAVVMFVVVRKMVKALRMDADALEQVAKGKLNTQLNEANLKRKDEVGHISRSIMTLKTELMEIIGNIKDQGKALSDSSVYLSEKAETSADHIGQVERAVEEIAQGATGQAEETQKATENVIIMGNMIEETTDEIDAMNENAKLIKQLGQTAIDTLKDLQTINQRTKESIDIIYEQTNTTNSSAQKIKEATALITDIAEETNLLSLNASIEAARAGEQGRGFAVVAAQIQKLAEQSNESARQIEEIITSLLADSEKAVDTMEEVKDIMGQQNDNVMKTDEQVNQVLGQVDQAIEAIGRVAVKTEKLNEARINVTDTVQNLTAVAQENAASTQQSAASVNQVSEIIQEIAESAKQLTDIAEKLDKDMALFEV